MNLFKQIRLFLRHFSRGNKVAIEVKAPGKYDAGKCYHIPMYHDLDEMIGDLQTVLQEKV